MKRNEKAYSRMVAAVPDNVRREINLSFDISGKIEALMKERGLSTMELANAMGKSPAMIGKWLSGQYNFSLATISDISSFFGKDIIKL